MDVLTEGYALPVSGGLYPPPPYLYRGATAIIASYEADPAAITGLLPPGVTPLEDPPVCLAWVVHYPFSTLGVYNEAIMLVRVSFEGEPYTFCPFIYVDNDAALACGRELWGFPKKLARMGYARPAAGEPFGEQMMFTVERPAGKRLLTVTMNPERLAAPEEVSFLPALTLRRIPNSRLGAQPAQHLRADQDRLLGSSRDQRGRDTGAVDRPVLGDDGFRLRVRPARRDGAGTDARRPVRRRGHHAAAGHAGQGLPRRGRGGRTASIPLIEETNSHGSVRQHRPPRRGDPDRPVG